MKKILRLLGGARPPVSVQATLPLLPHPDQKFGCVTYSQHGDDLIILAVTDAIGIDRPTYIDIGAHHPFNISNTALLYSRGWRGINIEANPNLFEAFLLHRPEDINLNIGIVPEPAESLTFYMVDKWSGRNSFNRAVVEEFVAAYPGFAITETLQIPVKTVKDVIDQYWQGVFPDLLSIDVEGLDEQILRSIDYSVSSPKIICVETVGADGRRCDESLRRFLGERGYFALMRCGGNTIFVQERYRYLVT